MAKSIDTLKVYTLFGVTHRINVHEDEQPSPPIYVEMPNNTMMPLTAEAHCDDDETAGAALRVSVDQNVRKRRYPHICDRLPEGTGQIVIDSAENCALSTLDSTSVLIRL